VSDGRNPNEEIFIGKLVIGKSMAKSPMENIWWVKRQAVVEKKGSPGT
jgi:hypothetical protein